MTGSKHQNVEYGCSCKFGVLLVGALSIPHNMSSNNNHHKGSSSNKNNESYSKNDTNMTITRVMTIFI